MTVENITCKTATVGPLAIGAEIPFLFPITTSSELIVRTRVIATGVEHDLIENTHYTVEIDQDNGGSVTMLSAIAALTEIHLIRTTILKQQLDLEAGGAFNAENVEEGFDKATRELVEHQDVLDRTIHAAVTDDSLYSKGTNLELPDPTERASTYLGFDANGAVTATDILTLVPTPPGTVSISNFGQSLIDDANGSAAQTTLGFGTYIKSILDDLTAAGVLTTLGISAFIQMLLDDADAETARDTLGVVNTNEDIVCYNNQVVCYNNKVVIYLQ